MCFVGGDPILLECSSSDGRHLSHFTSWACQSQLDFSSFVTVKAAWEQVEPAIEIILGSWQSIGTMGSVSVLGGGILIPAHTEIAPDTYVHYLKVDDAAGIPSYRHLAEMVK